MQVWVPLKGRVVTVLGILVGVRFQSKRDEPGCPTFVNVFTHMEEKPRTHVLFWLRKKLPYLLQKHTDFQRQMPSVVSAPFCCRSINHIRKDCQNGRALFAFQFIQNRIIYIKSLRQITVGALIYI